jgi:hypothetical protein
MVMVHSHNLNAVVWDGIILGQRAQIGRANDDGRHALYLNGRVYAWLPPEYDQEMVEDFVYDYIRARDGE